MDQDVKDNVPEIETGSAGSSPSETNQSESQDSSSSELNDFVDGMLNDETATNESGTNSEVEQRTDKNERPETDDREDSDSEDAGSKDYNSQPEYSRAEERKQQLSNEIRGLAAERDRIKAEVEKYKEFEIPSVEQVRDYLMDQDPELSEADAEMQARIRINEAVLQRREQIDQITGVRHEQQLAAYQAAQEYPELFDSNHPDFNRDIANGVMEMFEATAGVRRAGDGAVIAANTELYPFLRTVGEIYRAGLMKGKSAGEAEIAAEKARMEAEAKERKSKQSRAASSSPLYPSSENVSKTDEDALNDFVKSMLED